MIRKKTLKFEIDNLKLMNRALNNLISIQEEKIKEQNEQIENLQTIYDKSLNLPKMHYIHLRYNRLEKDINKVNRLIKSMEKSDK